MGHGNLLWLGVMVSVVVGCSPQTESGVEVRPGIDVLVTDSIHLIENLRVGLITNQTGVGRSGAGDIDLLLSAGVNLTTLFSPEHGFRGILDRPGIENDVDSATGLPIYSLYGEVRAPSEEMLSNVDVLLVDLQDIGARPYTYISATLLAMRSAEAADISILVLDRPNPIGGRLVQGPLLAPGDTSYVGMLQVPLRHGLTLGELALLGNDELGIGARLTVIPADGWTRDSWFDQTGLPWVRPSPNMPDLESATHYPGQVIFEALNTSVGRGTPIAFQLLGAPWMDPQAILADLQDIPGVLVKDTVFTPDEGARKYPGEEIPGLRFLVSDRETYDPTKLASAIFESVMEHHGSEVEIREAGFDSRFGMRDVRAAAATDAGVRSLWAQWDEQAQEFWGKTEGYRLYR
ncbi:MAG: DUF1343 domain-containing protein [Gemmatimonadota bacterium]|nr:DUF1343 domain-containing protein [Gemmatimonadota bacterium]